MSSTFLLILSVPPPHLQQQQRSQPPVVPASLLRSRQSHAPTGTRASSDRVRNFPQALSFKGCSRNKKKDFITERFFSMSADGSDYQFFTLRSNVFYGMKFMLKKLFPWLEPFHNCSRFALKDEETELMAERSSFQYL